MRICMAGVIIILFLSGCATKSTPVKAVERKNLYISDCDRYAEIKDELRQKVEDSTSLLLNGGRLDSKARVAVVDFVELSGSTSDFDRFIVEEFINNLSYRRVEIVDRRLLGKVLDELKLNSSDLFNPRFSAKFGELTGATAILTGTTVDMGGSVRINARLIETGTGRIISTAASDVQKTVSICRMIKQNLTAGHEKKPYNPSPSSPVAAKEEKSPEAAPLASNNKSSQRIKYMDASVIAFERLNNGYLRATIRFSNLNKRHGLAVALKAVGSDGIADFWKFMPTSSGVVTDEAGNRYNFSSASGIGFARTTEDWTVLNPGESIPVTIEFYGGGGNSDTFTLSLDIRLAWKDEFSTKVNSGIFNLYLQHLMIKGRSR